MTKCRKSSSTHKTNTGTAHKYAASPLKSGVDLEVNEVEKNIALRGRLFSGTERYLFIRLTLDLIFKAVAQTLAQIYTVDKNRRTSPMAYLLLNSTVLVIC